MSAYTPGPWVVTHQTATDHSWDVVAARPAGGVVVATCGCCRDPESREASNARLIAAAPELLAALRHSLAFVVDGQLVAHRMDHRLISRASVAEEIRALLAEGRP